VHSHTHTHRVTEAHTYRYRYIFLFTGACLCILWIHNLCLPITRLCLDTLLIIIMTRLLFQMKDPVYTTYPRFMASEFSNLCFLIDFATTYKLSGRQISKRQQRFANCLNNRLAAFVYTNFMLCTMIYIYYICIYIYIERDSYIYRAVA